MLNKKQFIGLVGKVLIGTSLAFGSGSVANAQQVYVIPGYDQKMMNQAMANLAVANMSGVVASGINDPRAANLIRGIGQLNRDLAWMGMNQATNRNTIIILNGNRSNEELRSSIYNQSKTFIARGFNDFNQDSHAEWKEFDKLNDTIYSTTEPFIIGGYVALKGQKENLRVSIYDPKGTLTANGNLKFNGNDFEFSSVPINTDELVTKGGSGTYVATFFYGDKFWEARSFQLIKPGDRVLGQGTYRTFVCNRIQDLNNDGKIDLEEIIGLDKNLFRSDEPIEVGVFLQGAGIKDKTVKITLYNPLGEEIVSQKQVMPQDYSYWGMRIDPKIQIKNHGLGTYTAAYYLDDKFWNARNFEITE